MTFSDKERAALLALKGVGPTVITRLEQLGFASLEQLQGACMEDIVAEASALVGSTCWKNSPQAKAAINNVLALAKSKTA